MKKIKTQKKPQKVPMSLRTKILWFVLAAIAIFATIFFILKESVSNNLIVKNNSELKLEYVKAYFVGIEGPISNKLLFENLESGDKQQTPLGSFNLSYLEANLEVRFKLEGQEEMFVDAGYFNDQFSGEIKIDFLDTEDENVLLKIKSSGGILPTPNIICDEEHIINLEEGYVE